MDKNEETKITRTDGGTDEADYINYGSMDTNSTDVDQPSAPSKSDEVNDPSNEKSTDFKEDGLISTESPVLNDSHASGDSGTGNAGSDKKEPKNSSDDVGVNDCAKFNSDKEILLDEDPEKGEPLWRFALETTFPLLCSGFGLTAAGYVFGIVQHWEVFTKVSEVFILVPALLGLKGNLEMTLASRLSTQANLGNMDTTKEQWKMIGGNLALIQAQAIVVGFLASIAAMILGWIPEGKFSLTDALLLSASSVLTAAVASFILGAIMALVVVLSRKCKINPDNVATPIAASLGDLTTLALLSSIAAVLYKAKDTQQWLAPVLLVAFLALTPLWCVIAHKNKYTSTVLYTGWTPVIGAMSISSIGGLILDFTVSNFTGIAVFQPVINGVGGNLVAVQASRLSTALHKVSTPGVLPVNAPHGCANPFTSFFGKTMSSRTARVLMLMVIPGHLIFMYTIAYVQAGHTSITPIFAVVYLSAATIQVAILLYLANWMVHLLWKRGNDPDNFSIPYLTALGDLLGTGLLAIAFHILYAIKDPTVVDPDNATNTITNTTVASITTSDITTFQ